jgi:uncharacterized protein
MSSEGNETPSGQGLPYSWLHLLSGLAALLVAAVVCAALIAQFLASRPLNLVSVCTELAGAVEGVLTTNQIPRGNISGTSGELRQDDGAKWRHYEFLVDVPDALSASGIATVLQKDMALRNVSAWRDNEADTTSESLTLALGEREFAKVRLTARPGRTDMSAACARVAREVLALLDTTPPIWIKENDQSLPRENETTVWLVRRVDASLAPGTEPAAIQNLIEQVMARRDVHVPAETGAKDDETLLTVMLSGVPCLAMHLRHAEELPYVELPALTALAPASAAVETPETPADPRAESSEPETRDPAATGGAKTGAAPSPGARVAIIVDDGGQDEAIDAAILALDNSLTLAIQPNERFSTATAEQAAALGFEVMVHMPMECDTERWAEPGQLYAKMKPDAIRTCVDKALKEVPGAVGMNNHTGSVFTSNKSAMKSLLAVLKEHDLYFVDSRTTLGTVAFETAQAMSVRSGSRDVFLDNDSDLAYIRGQCTQLIAGAKRDGTAIGICHFRKKTAIALARIIPEIKKAGVEIVHASEVVQ